MRHRKAKKNLGRDSAHQKALFQNLAKSLVTYELIQTTDSKAKRLRSVADKLITLGKRNTLHSRRQAFAILGDKDLVAKVFEDLAKREEIASRNGGYTRVLKLKERKSDAAPISRISFVGSTLENTAKYRFPQELLDQYEADTGADTDEDEE